MARMMTESRPTVQLAPSIDRDHKMLHTPLVRVGRWVEQLVCPTREEMHSKRKQREGLLRGEGASRGVT